MYKVFRRALNLFYSYSNSDKKLRIVIARITGRKPITLKLYKLAFTHASSSLPDKYGRKESYERLEYLGDAFLGAIIAEYLYKRYPFKDEGFLTEIRSRIVNRESLNQLGRKLGLENIIEVDKRNSLNRHKSIYGDIMEALIGAFYLDHGFATCKHFVLNQLLEPNFDIQKIISENTNYKSQLIEWSQKNNKEVKFETENISERGNFKEFVIALYVNDTLLVKGYGPNKKKAEQSAARKGLELILA